MKNLNVYLPNGKVVVLPVWYKFCSLDVIERAKAIVLEAYETNPDDMDLSRIYDRTI